MLFTKTAREKFILRIAIIIGSTRPGCKAEAVAKWVYEIAQNRSDVEFELVDIKEFNLPLLDEPVSPIMGQYTHQHTKNMVGEDRVLRCLCLCDTRVQPRDFGRAQKCH